MALCQLRAWFSLEWPLSNLTFQLFFSFSSWFCHPGVPAGPPPSEEEQGAANGSPSKDSNSRHAVTVVPLSLVVIWIFLLLSLNINTLIFLSLFAVWIKFFSSLYVWYTKLNSIFVSIQSWSCRPCDVCSARCRDVLNSFILCTRRISGQFWMRGNRTGLLFDLCNSFCLSCMCQRRRWCAHLMVTVVEQLQQGHKSSYLSLDTPSQPLQFTAETRTHSITNDSRCWQWWSPSRKRGDKTVYSKQLMTPGLYVSSAGFIYSHIQVSQRLLRHLFIAPWLLPIVSSDSN